MIREDIEKMVRAIALRLIPGTPQPVRDHKHGLMGVNAYTRRSNRELAEYIDRGSGRETMYEAKLAEWAETGINPWGPTDEDWGPDAPELIAALNEVPKWSREEGESVAEGLLRKILTENGYTDLHWDGVDQVLVLDGSVPVTPEEESYIESVFAETL